MSLRSLDGEQDMGAIRCWAGSAGEPLFLLVASKCLNATANAAAFEIHLPTGAPLSLPGLANYGVASYCAALGQLCAQVAANAAADVAGGSGAGYAAADDVIAGDATYAHSHQQPCQPGWAWYQPCPKPQSCHAAVATAAAPALPLRRLPPSRVGLAASAAAAGCAPLASVEVTAVLCARAPLADLLPCGGVDWHHAHVAARGSGIAHNHPLHYQSDSLVGGARRPGPTAGPASSRGSAGPDMATAAAPAEAGAPPPLSPHWPPAAQMLLPIPFGVSQGGGGEANSSDDDGVERYTGHVVQSPDGGCPTMRMPGPGGVGTHPDQGNDFGSSASFAQAAQRSPLQCGLRQYCCKCTFEN
eukprot:XP_001699520.1 predicted protein [Chlamydomonas reinhardtii]